MAGNGCCGWLVTLSCHAWYGMVALAEGLCLCVNTQATRMNTLLVELKRSMEELQLGLDGALNMSDKMEALARGIATNTVSPR